MNYNDFQKMITGSAEEICREVYQDNQDTIRIKKEKTAVKNFEIIFNAVFKISYKKGFQAMSMRDLSGETGLSMGALYGYFSSKEELLHIMQKQGRVMIKRVLTSSLTTLEDPFEKLCAAIKGHIYLSEMARPWFFFTFMEARNLNTEEFKEAQDMEAYTETVLTDILGEGEKQGLFKPGNHALTASLIKAMQQDWYLKRWKYKKKNIHVDQYAGHVIAFVDAFCRC
jgi:AcrR family transcriptional regulator